MTTAKMSISRQPYPDKIPGNDGEAWANLYRSLKHVEMDEAQIADAVYRGHAIAPVLNGWRSYDHFIAGQFIGIDMDTEDSLSAMSSLIDHDLVQMYGAILYSTQNSRPTKPHTRVIHLLDKPITDVYEYKAAIKTVSRAYAGYDRASAEPTRTFFGNFNLSKSHNVDGIWFSSACMPVAFIDEMRMSYAAVDAANRKPTPNYADVDMDVEKFVQSCISKGAEGNRNALCYWMSCRLVEKGVDTAAQDSAIAQFATAMGDGFEISEAMRCLRSARTGRDR